MCPDPTGRAGDGAHLDGLNADAVTDRLDALRDRWDDPPVETCREEAFDYDGLRGNVADGYLGGAYVWVVRDPADAPDLTESMPTHAVEDDRRVLFILNRGEDAWGLPGGGRESGESFEEAAVREEVGVDCNLTDCFLLRRCVIADPGGEGPPIHILQTFFDGVYRGGALRVQGGELNGGAWFADAPPSLPLQPENERRGLEFFD